jgi:pyruvate dehydrogenase (quinone)
LPTKGDVIQIDERPMVLGRRTPTILGVVGSARPALNLLLEKVKAKSDATFFERVTRERCTWDEMLDKQSDPARSKDKVHPRLWRAP